MFAALVDLCRISFAVQAPPVFRLSQLRGSDIHDFFENNDFDRFWNVILKCSLSYGRAERLGGPENGKTANEIQFSFDFLHAFSKSKMKQTCFDHNFSRSALIEPSFCIGAKLEELNNFYFDCFESYITKNARFKEIPGYLARARTALHRWGPTARIL